MRPVLFRACGLSFHAYPTMLYVGSVAGVTVGHYLARLSGLDAARITAATVLLVAPALFGARLLFVAINWNVYRREPLRIWRRSEGGAALYGGLLLSLACSVPLLHSLNLPLGQYWDVATVTILVGMMFTKVGCLLNGCCSGRPSDGVLTLYLPNHRGHWRRRVPTQLLEAAWAGVLLVGAAALWRQPVFDGAVFLVALGLYGLARLVLEPLREMTDRIGSVSVHQAISAALVAWSLASLLVLWPGA